jgi:endonuclease-3
MLEILRKSLSIRDEEFATLAIAKESADPFRVLVVIILSQNCTDIAALRAYRTLDERIRVTPVTLSKAKAPKIERAIRAAGLHKQKAKSLRKLAKIVIDQYSGDITDVLRSPLEQARVLLQELPNVGPKTADVLLAVWGHPTISVDTHVERVSKRLGLVPEKAKYEQIRARLMQLHRRSEYRSIPLLFMAHGRKTCKALKPRCFSCPVERFCPFPNKVSRAIGQFPGTKVAGLKEPNKKVQTSRSRSVTLSIGRP